MTGESVHRQAERHRAATGPSGDPEVQVRSMMKQLQSLFSSTRAV
jgi:hypothetical protein